MLSGLKLSLGLLTIIPVKPPAGITRRMAGWAMLWAPIAVLPVVAASVAAGWAGLFFGLPKLLCGILVVGVLCWSTRALHLDGLADTFDGLGSSPDKDRALEVMRSGDIGPMGAAALVLCLGAQAVAAGSMLPRPYGWLEVSMLYVLSRGFLVLACSGIPAARLEGLGALVAKSVPAWAGRIYQTLLAAGVVLIALCFGNWIRTLIAVAVALIAVIILLARCTTRLGGITGDTLGACVEIAATALLVVSAATTS
jgi:adenosylcobinamide-GDP ribazoletransferase